MADPHQQCKITVDGTNFQIQEPIPFNPKWYSRKFKGPGLRYEVAVCIKTGWIVWVNGQFPAGEWPDRKIAQAGINHHLDDNECYVGDRDTTMDDSEQKHLLDITIMNKKCMPWLGHVMKLLTDNSNSLGACRIPTATHYIGMEQCSMP